jgi:hypothetical protein
MNLSQSSATRGLEQATSDVIVIDSDSDSSSEDIWDIPNDDGIVGA